MAYILQTVDCLFTEYGYPSIIRSDGGPQFRSEFDEYCKKNAIKDELSSPYNPESNGLAESAGKNFKYIILRCEDKGEELKPAIAAWRNIVQAHCYFVKDEIRLEYLPGMNLISGRQVVCLCNDRNKTVPWQEYINPAKEQFLSCPKAKIRFFPVIDPENSWLIFWSLNFMCMSKSQAGEVVES